MSLLFVILFMPSFACAAIGDLDSSFGVGGVVTLANPAYAVMPVVIQADGRILISDGASLIRFNVDGSIDTSFGNAGKVQTNTSVKNIALQSNGKIVVLIMVFDPILTSFDSGLKRYNTNGTIDTTFGNGGTVIVDLSTANVNETPFGLCIQPDGKILLAGDGGKDVWGGGASLARFNTDGSLDASFGVGGAIKDYSLTTAYDILLQPDGKIVVGGRSFNFNSETVLARYHIDGTPDVSFGTSGYVYKVFSGYDYIHGIALQSDGNILSVVLSIASGTWTHYLMRNLSSGALDTTFGSAGVVLIDLEMTNQYGDILFQPDGKMIIAGFSIDPINNDNEFSLRRYNPDGSLDIGFGLAGRVTTDIGINTNDKAYAAALQKDGKIVIAGTSISTGLPGYTTSSIALTRYIGAVSPVPDVKVNGQDAALSLLMGNAVTVDISVLGNGLIGSNSDVFVGALTVNGNYWLRPNGNWVRGNPTQAYFTGPLTDIPLTNVLTYALPWRGVYTFFIIVDAVGNNTFDNMSYVDTALVLMGDTPPLALSNTAMQNEIKAKIRSLMTK